MKKEIYKVDFNAKLNKEDTEQQTYGCRQSNPDICGSNGLENICAFYREDHICKKPSKAWKKQYFKLINEKNN